ncbi:hypothetical protein POM88_049387 [Heracleum sosnowskyi]|uniref:Uncharacterized protein n=1 Tax=Heracleum sosnowskyi TaxID=360622 RepID=A0AAD8M0I0_9APIA|nr:hypothetical protein POM88_049387 [Heracleum sosnowskyi]
MGVQEELVVQNSVVDVHRVAQIGDPVERTRNDQVNSSRCNSDFGLWRGHEVNSEFVCLLDLIMNKYPETFEHFTTKNKKNCTMKLNLLCTSVNDFNRISLTDVNTEMFAEYRDVFAELQKFGFNISLLVSRLNYTEQICINDTKTKLQDLETLRAEKMQEIQKAFGTMVTNLVVGYIGDDLLSSP